MALESEPNHPEEKTGSHFSTEELLQARQQTWLALEKIIKDIQIGETEEEAAHRAKNLMDEMGFETQWHKINIRFGPNTVKSFREISDKSVRLQENDIGYIDIGPVWKGFEGDAGKSFVVGKNERLEILCRDSEEIFKICASAWKRDRLSGEALFHLLESEAKKRSWQVIGRHMTGHRLADFPHHAYHRGILADASFSLSPYAWVLEVCLLDPQTQRGAFFEDLLF